MNKIQELGQLGQSIWLDYIRRAFITSGELQALIDKGVRGVTSNPAIFEKAIAHSDDYDEQLQEMVVGGAGVGEVYEALALEDIRMATGLFLPVYEQSAGEDGYVSLEVNPNLAFDTEGTVAEARRYFQVLERPNLMIKVPATAEGVSAVEQLIADGINVNITLMFSMAHYEAVANAYIKGLERLAASGGDLRKVGSVASFFVSRVDVKLDTPLAEAGAPELQATIAIDNSKLVYQRFRELFSGERWQRLAAQGARVQRPLWASTGTKDPALSDTLYVDTLIGADTVNTLPPETLDAFLDHGTVALTVEDDMEGSRARVARLAELGIDLNVAGEELQAEGVDKFIAPFEALLGTIAARRDHIRAETQHISARLHGHQSLVDETLDELTAADIVGRIWRRDHTVWRPDPTEIADRLGWLDCAQDMLATYGADVADAVSADLDLCRAWGTVGSIRGLVDNVRADGYTHVLLLGMGGSSLAPELFGTLWGEQAGGLALTVLDSTNADAIRAKTQDLDPARTLYVVSTKSGGTVETRTLFQHCYAQASLALCGTEVGAHFVAITDPGSALVDLAQQARLPRHLPERSRHRWALLGALVLRPCARGAGGGGCAAVAGTGAGDGQRLSAGTGGEPGRMAGRGAGQSGARRPGQANAPLLAAARQLRRLGRTAHRREHGQGWHWHPAGFAGEPLAEPNAYGADRLFVQLQLEGDESQDAAVNALEEAGHPVLRLTLKDRYDLGAQCFLWEFAVAVAGWRMGINPFDQPDVESAKVQARQMVAAWQATGSLPQPEPQLCEAGVSVYSARERRQSGGGAGGLSAPGGGR